MMRTPDGHGRVELTKYRKPALGGVEPAIGIRRPTPAAHGAVAWTGAERGDSWKK